MDAISLLEGQHAQVMRMFQQYEDETDLAVKERLFEDIADNLAAHATIEEKLFYPAAFRGEMQHDLRVAVEEHLAVKRLIANLLSMSPGDEQFDAKMTVLCRLVENHVAEEQGELFPRVRTVLSPDRLSELGETMSMMFNKAMEGTPRNGVPAEALEAAPLPGRVVSPH